LSARTHLEKEVGDSVLLETVKATAKRSKEAKRNKEQVSAVC
jgi:hypothetical protein